MIIFEYVLVIMGLLFLVFWDVVVFLVFICFIKLIWWIFVLDFYGDNFIYFVFYIKEGIVRECVENISCLGEM